MTEHTEVEHNNPVKAGKGRPPGKRRSAGQRKLEYARLVVQTQDDFAEAIMTKERTPADVIMMLNWLRENP